MSFGFSGYFRIEKPVLPSHSQIQPPPVAISSARRRTGSSSTPKPMRFAGGAMSLRSTYTSAPGRAAGESIAGVFAVERDEEVGEQRRVHEQHAAARQRREVVIGVARCDDGRQRELDQNLGRLTDHVAAPRRERVVGLHWIPGGAEQGRERGVLAGRAVPRRGELSEDIGPHRPAANLVPSRPRAPGVRLELKLELADGLNDARHDRPRIDSMISSAIEMWSPSSGAWSRNARAILTIASPAKSRLPK